MERLKIDNSLVHSHPAWNKFGSSLCQVALKDYPRSGYFNGLNIDCLDVDNIEKSHITGISGAQPQETMDCCLGIAAIESIENKRQMLLVELRMGYTSISQVKFEDWRKKYEHSKDLLVGEMPISPRSIYIFSTSLAPVVERKRYSLSKVDRYLKNYYVLSAADVASTFVSPAEWPIPCEVDENALRMELKQKIQKGDEDALIHFSSYWKDKAVSYYSKFLLQEHITIIRIFREELTSLKNSRFDPLCIELILEDFPEINN